MAAGLETDVQVMAKAAQHAANISAQLSATAEAMSTQLSVLNTGWVGAGGGAFQGAHQRIRGDMDRINGALGRLSTLIGDASRQYTTSDDETHQEVTRAGSEAGTIAGTINF
ncbi:hypothetical protein GCM10027280_57110 [Micromonospora polyrhachis]|uniref:WXG100 family type VII secretion target n=1 Tax=Micromonospora polyrhachis TaxID=1282883 RepID=A0A7W7SSN1_9ACTN|nr:WXG100 family type VII secretion target [Micromonospora polyrhachis]MBB4960234.1 WXG100 family type VII secretion target [Micromonospora polyrhachis]